MQFKPVSGIAVLYCLLHTTAYAQNTYAPMPFVKAQFRYDSGLPVAGGKLCTLECGTNTKLATYSAPSAPENTNPITPGAGGRAAFYLRPQAHAIRLYAPRPAFGNACGAHSGGPLI